MLEGSGEEIGALLDEERKTAAMNSPPRCAGFGPS